MERTGPEEEEKEKNGKNNAHVHCAHGHFGRLKLSSLP